MRNLDLMLDRLRSLPPHHALDQLEFAVWEQVARGKAAAMSFWPANLSFNVATTAGALIIGSLIGAYGPQHQAHAFPSFELVDQPHFVGDELLQQVM